MDTTHNVIVGNELHDAHSSHYEGANVQSRPMSSLYEHALRLYREAPVYPDRVRVSPCAVQGTRQAGISEQGGGVNHAGA